MAVEVLLPKIGLTMQEGTIDEWLVPTGGAVSEGDALLRLATDKVDVDVEAEAGGLFHPLVQAGATLPAGALIGWLLAEGEELPVSGGSVPTGPVDAGPADAVSPGVPPVAASLSGNGGLNGSGDRLLASPNARRVAAETGVDLTAVRGTGPGGRIVSEDVEEYLLASAAQQPVVLSADPVTPTSPLVRRLAKERGIDLADVHPTGAGGRIRRADLDAVTPASAPAPARQATASPQAGEVVPLTGMRGVIAGRMHASLQEMAQLTHGYEVRMDAVVALREQLKQEWADSALAVPSLGDFLMKAAALALRDHPLLNAGVLEDGIHLFEDIHLGFAVAVPNGLLVPVIQDAADLSLPEMARCSRELAENARAGRISPAQLEGATFTVTSLGGYGVDFFTPVVNPGNVAILGVGRLRDGVEWVDDQPRRTRVLTLSLTFDHRAVDGAPAAEYLRTLGELLRKPLRLLL
ncbi:pyruvate/2-oxoglutarate dehydrogenase complex dihydrolipoamide acyltransferase (E2) component [Streptomyces canus]|uniref:Dihydrolipoamide acetyltransferase component of pyruvate dehydrogenase complex n=1 Tax=Streptomyces canus TaxID=58343 RepID=A0AAW8F5K0_9ACTN|nr:2-oxo acid dehydrogenase subunit E2 [Streptomyces canus]MDQ0905389.1 pyruvate/2-oxoglutarate dehydrogenase complex dihydrolipoamide acyltransferase (E2) component [Streptomyces canus]